MVMTVLEAHVSPENWTTLEQAFQLGAQQKDPGLEQSFLVQSKKESDLWRIITVWSSQEALDTMRSLVESHQGLVMFRSAREAPGFVLLKVRDTGSGIAPEDLPLVFNRFYRGGRSRQVNGDAGLGLTIAKSLVTAQGGEIEVASQPGEGATFTIRFPAVAAEINV